MKNFFTFLAIIGAVSAVNETDEIDFSSAEDAFSFLDSRSASISNYGLILNTQAKRAVKNLVKQMPCGWPQYGIPPLAPYRNEQINIHETTNFVDAILSIIRFKITGLDNMQIKKLEISYTFRKEVRYHLIFKNITSSAKNFVTDTIIDLMYQYGFSIRYEGSGNIDQFSIENLSISGSFKYKMPFIFGSIKIYNLKCVVRLESCTSKVNGLVPNEHYNRLINNEIEDLIPMIINENQKQISKKIEDDITKTVNESLKGKKIWSVIASIVKKPSKCVAPPDPWD